MSDADELVVAEACRFALDVFTILQQDCPTDLELEELGCAFRASAFSTGGRARASAWPFS